MKKLALISSVSLITLGVASVSFAHHSSAPHFDNTIDLSLDGVVTDWKMVNPHGYIYFDVTTNGETVNWRCETTSGSSLRRQGFSDETFAIGTKVTIKGNPARREANHCYASSFVFPDGNEIARYGVVEGATSEVVAVADTPREKTLANGQPNISGYWVRAARGAPPARPAGGQEARGGARGAGGQAGGGRGGAAYDLTEAALATQAKYEQIYDDPSVHCDIGNIFFGWGHDSHVNAITQEDDKVIMQYGYMDYVRTIHLGMNEHPANIEPSRGGHSIGSWEGDTLVVDTIGFTSGVLHPLNGTPHSDQMHTVEKISYDAESKSLKRDYLITDPLYLNKPYSGSDSQNISAQAYEPYNCTELSGDNNRRPGSSEG